MLVQWGKKKERDSVDGGGGGGGGGGGEGGCLGMCLPGLPDLCLNSLVSFYWSTNTNVYHDIDGLAGEEEELATLVERLDKAFTAYGLEISARRPS